MPEDALDLNKLQESTLKDAARGRRYQFRVYRVFEHHHMTSFDEFQSKGPWEDVSINDAPRAHNNFHLTDEHHEVSLGDRDVPGKHEKETTPLTLYGDHDVMACVLQCKCGGSLSPILAREDERNPSLFHHLVRKNIAIHTRLGTNSPLTRLGLQGFRWYGFLRLLGPRSNVTLAFRDVLMQYAPESG